jgi:hypothetical protein
MLSKFDLRGTHPELRERRISDEMLETVIASFSSPTSNFLTVLDLSYNNITDAGALTLSSWLKVCMLIS